MSITLTRSKVKADKMADVEAGIKRLIPALEQAHQDMRYAWFRLEDGVTFVILVDTGEASTPPPSLPEFQAFTKILKVSMDGAPITEKLTLSGSYHFF